jgi:hypothetical protein
LRSFVCFVLVRLVEVLTGLGARSSSAAPPRLSPPTRIAQDMFMRGIGLPGEQFILACDEAF